MSTSEPRPRPKPVAPLPNGANGAAVRVIGCGRWQRGDDEFGLRVAESLGRTLAPRAFVTATESPGADLILDLEHVELLIVADAARASREFPCGATRRFVFRGGTEPCGGATVALPKAGRAASSHELSVAEALRLAEALGELPPEVWIYAAAGTAFSLGDPMTPSVMTCVEIVSDAIRTNVAAWLAAGNTAHA